MVKDMFDFDTEEGLQELSNAKLEHEEWLASRLEEEQSLPKPKKNSQPRKMPAKKAIKKYWDTDSNGECRFRFIRDFGWKELPINACWRCGETGYVEKAHIWARSDMTRFTNKTDKEMDSPSNLHLLCKPCHKYSEPITGWAPGLAYYEWFYTTRESTKHNPMLPQVWKENRFYSLMLMNRISEDLGFDLTEDRNPTDKEIKKLKKWRTKFIDNGCKTGETILFKDRYKRFKKLSKEKGKEYTDYMIHEGVF